MHIFRHTQEVTTAARLWQTWEAAWEAGSGLDALLACARLECACADQAARGHLETPSGSQALLRLSLQTAAFYLRLKPRPGREALRAAQAALPPGSTRLRLAALEGVRFYALSPEAYAAAARQWLRVRNPARAQTTVWVLGLRSMGSLLAPVVAATLEHAGCRTRCLTLRPIGPPAQRRLRLARELRKRWAESRDEFLIVDEGPGLSGSSFGGSVRSLRHLGVAPDRIALLAAWAPSRMQAASFSDPLTAREWSDWPVFAAPPLAPPEPGREISGGGWRHLLGAHPSVAVWPQHERRKFLCRRGTVLAKFAGFGPYAEATLARAQALERNRWGPRLADGANQYITQGWILYRRAAALPLQRPNAAWCAFAGRYLAGRAAAFHLAGSRPPTPALRQMLRVNLQRLLQLPPPAEVPAGPVMAPDGHMMPWEWGVTANGFVKFDGTDHCDDPFFPGPADVAWDLAAVAAEFGPACGTAVLEAYCRASGETIAQLEARLRWHQLAYTAFRAAYCHFAATQTLLDDRRRFRHAAQRYSRQLRALCAVRASAAGSPP
ncbi:MAG: hypothetical protein ACRD1Y_01560 [Terriglobales bacterium]